MSTFNKKAILPATTSQISDMAKAIEQEFYKDGYDVKTDTLMNGGCDISISKGGTFKAVLGMRSALKVCLTPTLNGVQFDAHVGIFGQQAIPTVISMFFFWPVLITQIWGMVSQSKMDDRALAAAQSVLVASSISQGIVGNTGTNNFCTSCGAEVPADAAFCPKCGNKL